MTTNTGTKTLSINQNKVTKNMDAPATASGIPRPDHRAANWDPMQAKQAQRKVSRKAPPTVTKGKQLAAKIAVAAATKNRTTITHLLAELAKQDPVLTAPKDGQFVSRGQKVDACGPDAKLEIFIRLRSFLRIEASPEAMIDCSLIDFFNFFNVEIRTLALKHLKRSKSAIARATFRKLISLKQNARTKAASHGEPADTVGGGELLATAMQKSPAYFIGEFPGHLRNIIDMIKTATTSLDVMIDCVDFGSFSDPHLHDEMIQAICKASRDDHIAVNMLITEKPAPISRGSSYYGKGLEELEKEPEFQETRDRYLAFHQVFQNKPLTDDVDFIKILQDHQEICRRNLYDAGVKIYGLDGKPIQKCLAVRTLYKRRSKEERPSPHKSDLFFWIVDGKKAIFLLSNTAPSGWKMSFQTKNPDLVNILNRIFA